MSESRHDLHLLAENELLKDIEQLDQAFSDDPNLDPSLVMKLFHSIDVYQKRFPDRAEGALICLDILSHLLERDLQPDQYETLNALLSEFSDHSADEPAVYQRCANCYAKLAALSYGSERQACVDKLEGIIEKHSDDQTIIRTYIEMLSLLLKSSNRIEAEQIYSTLNAFYDRDPDDVRYAEAYAKALVTRSYFQNLRQDQSSVQSLEQLHKQFPLNEEIAFSYAKGLYNLTSDLKLTEYRLPLYHLSKLREDFSRHEGIATEYAQGLANLIVDLYDNENEIYLAILDEMKRSYPDNLRIAKAYAQSLAHCLRILPDESKLTQMLKLLDLCQPHYLEQEYTEFFFKGLAGLTGTIRTEFLCSALAALAEFYSAHVDDVNARLAYMEALVQMRLSPQEMFEPSVTTGLKKLLMDIYDDELYVEQLLNELDQYVSTDEAFRYFARIVAFPSQRRAPSVLPIKNEVANEFKALKNPSSVVPVSLRTAIPTESSDDREESHVSAQAEEPSVEKGAPSHPEKQSATEQNAERDLQQLQAQSYTEHMKEARQQPERSTMLRSKVVAGKRSAAPKPRQNAPEQIHRTDTEEVPYSIAKASLGTDRDITKMSKLEPVTVSVSIEELEKSLSNDPSSEQLQIDYAKALLNQSYQQEHSAEACAKLKELASQPDVPDDVLHAYASSLLHQIQQERIQNPTIPPLFLQHLDTLVQQHPGKNWLALLYAKELVNQSIQSDLSQDDSLVHSLEALHFSYSDDLDISIAYARILHNLSVDEKLTLESPTISKLQQLAEQHPDTFAITISYAKSLANLSYDVLLDADNDIIPRLRQLYEAHARNEDFAFRYARGLIHLSHDLDVSHHTHVIDDLQSLAETFPYSTRIVMEYASGLFNLAHDQTVDDAEHTLQTLEALTEQYRHHPPVAFIYAETIAKLCKRLEAEKTLGMIRRLEQLLLDYKYDKRIFDQLSLAIYSCAHRLSLDELFIFQEILQRLQVVFGSNRDFTVIVACIDLLIFSSRDQEDKFGWYDALKDQLSKQEQAEYADCLNELRNRLENLQEELDVTRSRFISYHILPHFSQLQAELEQATDLQ